MNIDEVYVTNGINTRALSHVQWYINGAVYIFFPHQNSKLSVDFTKSGINGDRVEFNRNTNWFTI